MNQEANSTVWLAYTVKEQIRITDMYSLFQAHYHKGYAFPGETHNFWECLYVMEGGVCVSGNERVYNLDRSSIIFHKPLELHKFIVNGQAGADLLIFSFTAEGPLTAFLEEKVFRLSPAQREIVDSMLSFIRNRAMSACAPRTNGSILASSLSTASASSKITASLQAADSSATAGFPLAADSPQATGSFATADSFGTAGSPMTADSALAPFLTSPTYSQIVASYLQLLMLSLAEIGSVSSVSDAPDAVTFRHAISYLNSNIHRQPSVPELARFCNVSEAGLKRIFEKYAGISIHKYLLKLKVKAAAELLQKGESVSSVAEKLGFNSQSYFSRAFKRETGFMPSSLK